ncbi:MAG TPA: DMT family transporter [Gaiellaceae bacterium]|nr:DMT family transporter [Gaiellaceae bacterium]
MELHVERARDGSAPARGRPRRAAGGELGYVVLLGVVFTAGTGYLYVWLIRRVTAQAMGILAYLEPVSAALLAWLLLDEALTWQTIFGGALIILGGLAVILLEREETGVVEVPPQPERV